MVSDALESSGPLHVAGMVVQAITGVRATVFKSKHNNATWGLRPGKAVALKCEMRGEDMWHFLAKAVDIVLPRVKEWKGVKGSSGDSSGNISFGLTSEAVAAFPEVECNYDM
jgi:large subunit ribosomal protein L5